MIKNPHLVKELREKERKADIPFVQKAQRYDEMYEMAVMLNPELRQCSNEQHLDHIIELKGKLNKLSKLE